MPRIMPRDSRRERSHLKTPVWSRRCGACQMRSSAFCSSPNTEVAPITSAPTPKAVAARPARGWFTLASSAWTARAPSAPIRLSSWSRISPRAACSPKNSPATEITINSNGAIENIV